MKVFVLIVPHLTEENHFLLQNELSMTIGRSEFTEIHMNTWLIKCDFGATSLRYHLEQFLGDSEDFSIFELADRSDFCFNVNDLSRGWISSNL